MIELEKIWDEASMNTKLSERLKNIMENTLYTIACLLSDDISYYYLLILKTSLMANCEEFDKKYQFYEEYALTRLIVQLNFQRKQSQALTSEYIINSLSYQLDNSDKIKNVLQNNFTMELSELENLQIFSLQKGCLAMFDPFIYPTKDQAISSGLRTFTVIETIKLPTEFDGVFGELSKAIYNEKSFIIPFNSLMKEVLATNDTIKFIKSLLTKYTSEISPWLFRCCIKILICLIPYIKFQELIDDTKSIINLSLNNILPNNDEKLSPLAIEYRKYFSIHISSQDLSSIKSQLPPETIYSDFKWVHIEDGYYTSVIQNQEANINCAYCQSPLDINMFHKNCYGRFIFIQASGVLDRHLEKIKEKYKIPDDSKKSYNDLIISTCGHYIHDLCFTEIQKQNIDENCDYILCPICKLSANAILPPEELIQQGDKETIEKTKENILYKIWKHYNLNDQYDMTVTRIFKMLCRYVAYELTINSEEVLSKTNIILSLIWVIKFIMQENETKYFAKIKKYIEYCFDFMKNKCHKLFDAKLTKLWVVLLIGGKIMETSSNRTIISYCIREKIKEIIQMYIMQITMKKIYDKVGNKYEKIYEELYNKENFESISKIENIKGILFPFLQRMIILKEMLYPLQIKIEPENTIVYFMQSLDLLSYRPPMKLYLDLPHMSKQWMKSCWKFLLSWMCNHKENNLSKIPKSIPMLEAETKKPQLIEMEIDYNELQKKYASKKCSICGKVNSDSALCLICGDLFCFTVEEKKSSEPTHPVNCSKSCRIFLRFATNQVYCATESKICCYHSPYLNKNGESDHLSNIDEPLKLNSNILEAIKTLYVTHKLKQSINALSSITNVDAKDYNLKL